MTDPSSLSTPASPRTSGPPPVVASRLRLWLLVGLSLVVFVGAFWLVVAKLPGLLMGPRNGAPAQSSAPTTAPAADIRRIRVSLFYVSDTGLELVPVRREIAYGATPSEHARHIVEAQIQTPPPGFASAIPEGTTLRTVYLAPNGVAFVDLGPEIVANHRGGSLDEALAVYAIVNALTTGMDTTVTSVQILINGKQVDTLAGHIDLRQPLTRSLDWIQKGK
jgi:germination protein M